MDPAKITESVNHSWYEYSGGDANGKHPSKGETNPEVHRPQAALRVSGCRQEVFLAEDAAL